MLEDIISSYNIKCTINTMLSLGNSDTNNCVTYLENYLDCVENLPDDLQKQLSRIRELDVSHQNYLQDIEFLAAQYNECIGLGKSDDSNKVLRKVQSTLIASQEIGDEKLQIVQKVQDLIEKRTRSLDNDFRNIDNGSKERDSNVTANSSSTNSSSVVGNNNNSSTEINLKEQTNVPVSSSTNNNNEQRQSKRVRRGRGEIDNNHSECSNNTNHHYHYVEHSGSIPMPRVTATLLINNQKKNSSHSNLSNVKKKKRKTKQMQRVSMQKDEDNRRDMKGMGDDDDEGLSIDPDEPTYCLCDQISYGEMICCDNDLCPIEWFHFSCVSLTTKPKGKWFCPKCRGDRPNVMKPKAQFLKELERYNREKEEKARSY